MSEEWISGCGPATRDPGGAVDALRGITVGPGCRVQILADEEAQVVMAGDFRSPGNRARALLDAAWRGRWAELTDLDGSYWVVAQNPRARFVCGDVSGFRSVFYRPGGDGVGAFVWSTSARRLAARYGAQPDLMTLAARLAAGAEHWPHHTAYQNIQAVPGGFGLLLTADGSQRLIDVSGIHPHRTLTAGAPAFATALERAVHSRMEAAGTAGADVSGGLDSSTLAILAAEKGTVRAVTYTDPHTSAEDLRHARRVAGHIRTPLHEGTGGPGELPFAWSAGQPVTEQPAAASLDTAQHALHLRPAAGLPLHFTGHGGDVVLDGSSAVWTAMVQDGRRRVARREVTGWARTRNRSPRELWSAVTRAAATGYPGALLEAADRLETGVTDPRRPGVWTWCHLGHTAQWLTPGARHQVAALLRESARAAEPTARADLVEQRSSLRLIAADARDTIPLEASWNVRLVHPYLDNAVVRAAFAITPAERHGTTVFKPLLGAALPRLPHWLTGRTTKGSFTRQLLTGLLHHQRQVAELIATGPLVTAGLLDPGPALAALARAGTRAEDLYDLHRLAMTCQWLTAHSNDRLMEKAC
ncbi:asparagine synthase-related protein [Streptomyces sp. NPDC059816]|uniref:asparagine synthase-related protein n=1 Tax=Streptomyces sp. NPDC059816 TaxID=3346960 RepID=UPI00365DD7F1